MDGANPAAAAIIERVLVYLDSRTVSKCKTLNKTWHALTAVRAARDIDCHIVQLPLRIAHYRRNGLLSSARGLTIDIGHVDGFLSPRMYEHRIHAAAALVREASMPIRHLKLHAPGAQSTLSDMELRYGAMAASSLLQALPGLATLDLSDCPAPMLSAATAAQLAVQPRLQRIKWFSLGSNDLSSAAALQSLVSASVHSLVALDGRGDVSDQALYALCAAPGFCRLNASGSSISDDALLALVRSRGHALEELVLSDCTRLTRRSISQLTPKHLPRLATLDLYNVMVTTDTYQGLFNTRAHWPHLRDLKLKAAIPHTSPRQDSLVNDDILEAIGRNCPRLVSLRLFGCHGTTDDGLSAILGNLGYLRELVVMHHPSDPVAQDDGDGDALPASPVVSSDAGELPPSSEPAPGSGLLLSVPPSADDVWADIPSLPSNALPQPRHSSATARPVQSPPSTAPNSPCLSTAAGASGPRVFTSQALRNGVRSRCFNLLNLDMAYDSACAEHLAKLTHLHVLCGRVITRHAKSLLETQFPKCKMMVWNID
ncbi:hypothetical protein GGF46_000865 [Coemansia sp. RSA 552]|nr:hypothetical protein GGF46_000865 [Coemansia sp. RSA 552]